MPRLREYILILSALFVFASPAVAPLGAVEPKWSVFGSRHFIIHYRQAPQGLLNRVADKAEDYYSRITEELGFTRYNFWLGDNRAMVFIFDDIEDYLAVTGQPEWSSGCVIIPEKKIYSYSQGWDKFSAILSHEIGHIIFRECVGTDKASLPLWLDEGVACFVEQSGRSKAIAGLVRDAANKGKFLSFEELERFVPSEADDRSAGIFYAESASLVAYLIEEFGKDNFVYFCESFRRNGDIKKALRSAYPFEDSEQLERGWRLYLRIL